MRGGEVGLVREGVVADEVELEALLRWLDICLQASFLPGDLHPAPGELLLVRWLWTLPLPSFMGVRGYLVPAGGSPFSQMTRKVLLFLMGSLSLLAFFFSVVLRLPLSGLLECSPQTVLLPLQDLVLLPDGLMDGRRGVGAFFQPHP